MKLGLSQLYSFIADTYSALSMSMGKGYGLPPLHAFLEVTYHCNQRCRMCYFLRMMEECRQQDRKKEMSTEEIKKVVDQIPGFALITITGGEPLTRKDCLEIVEYCGRGHKCNLISNGTLINEEKARRLVKSGAKAFWRKGLVAVGVSIESVGKTHDELTGFEGAYERAMRGIHLLSEEKKRQKKRYPALSLQTVLTAHNCDSLPELAGEAVKQGVNIVNLLAQNPRDDMNRLLCKEPDKRNVPTEKVEEIDPAKLQKLLDETRALCERKGAEFRFSPFAVPDVEKIKHYQNDVDLSGYICRAPFSRIMITAFGELIHCLNGYLGDLREEKLSDLLNGPGFREFRSALKESGVFPRCTGCCFLEYNPRRRRNKSHASK